MFMWTSSKPDQRLQLLDSSVQKLRKYKIVVKIDSIGWVFQFGIFINPELKSILTYLYELLTWIIINVGQLYPEKREWYFISLISQKIKILDNFDFVFANKDIHRFISSTELFVSDIRGPGYTGYKKVNFWWDTG